MANPPLRVFAPLVAPKCSASARVNYNSRCGWIYKGIGIKLDIDPFLFVEIAGPLEIKYLYLEKGGFYWKEHSSMRTPESLNECAEL
jgi:hypothetical protein